MSVRMAEAWNNMQPITSYKTQDRQENIHQLVQSFCVRMYKYFNGDMKNLGLCNVELS
jgi:hypothetical protein